MLMGTACIWGVGDPRLLSGQRDDLVPNSSGVHVVSIVEQGPPHARVVPMMATWSRRTCPGIREATLKEMQSESQEG